MKEVLSPREVILVKEIMLDFSITIAYLKFLFASFIVYKAVVYTYEQRWAPLDQVFNTICKSFYRFLITSTCHQFCDDHVENPLKNVFIDKPIDKLIFVVEISDIKKSFYCKKCFYRRAVELFSNKMCQQFSGFVICVPVVINRN